MASAYDYSRQSSLTAAGASHTGFFPIDSTVNLGTGVDNWLTGNLDYQRDLEKLGFQNAFTAHQSELERQFNSSEAQKNRDWQEYMSNTSYQRAAADMKAAGFNPALMFSQGGASTPSGSTASSGGASSGSGGAPRVGSHIGQALSMLGNLAISAYRLSLDTAQLELNRQVVSTKYGNQSARPVGFGRW